MSLFRNKYRNTKHLLKITLLLALTLPTVTSQFALSETNSSDSGDKTLTHSIQGSVYEYAIPRFVLENWPERITSVATKDHLKSGDFNGDYCSDLFFKDINSNNFQIATSNCKDRFTTSSWVGLPSDFPIELSVIGDFNGDGFSDLAAPSKYNEAQKWLIAYSDGKASFELKTTVVLDRSFQTSSYTAGVMNSNGRTGLLLFSSNNLWWTAVLAQDTDGKSFSYLKDSTIGEFRPDIDIFQMSNFKDDIEEEVIFKHKDFPDTYWVRSIISDTPNIAANEKFLWASFPKQFTWSSPIVGDFNGDGLADIITNGGIIAGWWIALSNGITGLELAIELPLSRDIDTATLVVGDFNGDGFDDFVTSSSEHNLFSVALAKPGKPLNDVDISIGSEKRTVKSTNGKFEFNELDHGTYFITPQKVGFTFNRTQYRLIIREQNLISKISFVALYTASTSEFIGQENQITGKPEGPYICLGYNPTGKYAGKWGTITDQCPSGYGMMGLESFDKSKSTSADVPTWGNCCKLPSDDIILNEDIAEATAECPDGYIAVGGKSVGKCPDCQWLFSCAKINSSRYQLGEKVPGHVLGLSMSLDNWKRRIDKNDVPLAVRYGILRTGYNSWENRTCTGNPVGSLLVKKAPGDCSNFLFRELQYIGTNGDPQKGTPVKMFPNCISMENIYDPTSGCKVE